MDEGAAGDGTCLASENGSEPSSDPTAAADQLDKIAAAPSAVPLPGPPAVQDRMRAWEVIAAEAFAADGSMDGWDSDAERGKRRARPEDNLAKVGRAGAGKQDALLLLPCCICAMPSQTNTSCAPLRHSSGWQCPLNLINCTFSMPAGMLTCPPPRAPPLPRRHADPPWRACGRKPGRPVVGVPPPERAKGKGGEGQDKEAAGAVQLLQSSRPACCDCVCSQSKCPQGLAVQTQHCVRSSWK